MSWDGLAVGTIGRSKSGRWSTEKRCSVQESILDRDPYRGSHVDMSAKTLNRTLSSMRHSPEAPDDALTPVLNCFCNSAIENPLRLFRNINESAAEQAIEVSPGLDCTTVSKKQRSIDWLAISWLLSDAIEVHCKSLPRPSMEDFGIVPSASVVAWLLEGSSSHEMSLVGSIKAVGNLSSVSGEGNQFSVWICVSECLLRLAYAYAYSGI